MTRTKKQIRFINSKFVKTLTFNTNCFVPMDKLFDRVLEKDPYGIPEKPYRNFIALMGNNIDGNRNLEENFRFQIIFFWLVILYHQVGDSLRILQENLQVKLKAVVLLPHQENSTGKEVLRPYTCVTNVGKFYELFLQVKKNYRIEVREFGKNIADFIAHSLDNMYPIHKRESQYSQKIVSQQWSVLREPGPGELKALPRLYFRIWSLSHLHVMLPVLQYSMLLAYKYPSVREALTVDMLDMKERQMTGSNATETQKENFRLRQKARYQQLIIVRLFEERKNLIQRNSQKNIKLNEPYKFLFLKLIGFIFKRKEKIKKNFKNPTFCF